MPSTLSHAEFSVDILIAPGVGCAVAVVALKVSPIIDVAATSATFFMWLSYWLKGWDAWCFNARDESVEGGDTECDKTSSKYISSKPRCPALVVVIVVRGPEDSIPCGF